MFNINLRDFYWKSQPMILRNLDRLIFLIHQMLEQKIKNHVQIDLQLKSSMRITPRLIFHYVEIQQHPLPIDIHGIVYYDSSDRNVLAPDTVCLR